MRPLNSFLKSGWVEPRVKRWERSERIGRRFRRERVLRED
jgi:hypothetical protein